MDVAPFPDRIGNVGGVESITVDGQRWYFGFDYGSDLVVSPLIPDPDAMARFASEHMVQTDGAHDPEYWRELVDWSVDESDLTDDPDDRTFVSPALARDRLRLNDHLQYLLGAASGWQDSFFEEPGVAAALTTIGVKRRDRDYDCTDMCIAALDADDPEVRQAAAYVMNRYVELVLETAPGNWGQVFASLRAPTS